MLITCLAFYLGGTTASYLALVLVLNEKEFPLILALVWPLALPALLLY